MKKITQDLFHEFKFLSNLNYNPNKSVAAFCVSQCNAKNNDYDQHLWITDGKEVKQLTSASKESLYTWLDDETVLFAAKRDDKKDASVSTDFYTISIKGGEAAKAFSLPLSVNSIKVYNNFYLVEATTNVNYPTYYKMSETERKSVDKEIKDNEDYQIVDEYPFFFNGAGYINKTRNSLYKVDKNTLAITPITKPTMNVDSYCVSSDETKVVYSGIDFKKMMSKWAQVYETNLKNNKTECLYKKADMLISHAFYLNKDVIVSGSFGDSVGAIGNHSFYKLKNKKMTLFVKNDTSMYGSIGTDVKYGHGKGLSVDSNNAYFITTVDSRAELYALKQGKLTSIIHDEGTVDDYAIGKNKQILVLGLFKQKLQEVYSFDGKTLKQISSFNTAVLKDKYVAKPKKCNVAKKPFDIHGWVLEPKDYNPKKKYPAILDIHGGPKCAYGEVYYHEMQYWANLGYFVFFCNPRGGDGRGDKFADLRNAWGTIDYEDIMDFTNKVLDTYPAIDQKKVAVTGGSYGGYMTNWIIGHTNRFCCAATQRSISNWITEVCASDYGIDFPVEMEFKDIHNCHDELWQMSPLKYANNVKTPTLFIHSMEDYRCPLTEGIQLYTAIRCNGVETKMCLFKGENHELSRGGKPLHRSKRLFEITSWIVNHTKEKK